MHTLDDLSSTAKDILVITSKIRSAQGIVTCHALYCYIFTNYRILYGGSLIKVLDINVATDSFERVWYIHIFNDYTGTSIHTFEITTMARFVKIILYCHASYCYIPNISL